MEQSQHARLSVFFLMSLFLAKFCVFFSSTCAFSNFPTVVQVDGKPFLRSTTGLCRLYIYPWKKREHGTHALAEVRSLLIFARQVDWFGMVWVRDGKSIAETESQGLKDHRSMGERSTAS